jgi:ComF family protein
MRLFSFIFSLFWEKKCYACGQVWHFFCPACNNTLDIYKPYCYVCKEYSHNFKTHRKCSTYFPLKQVIVLTHYRQTWIKKLIRHAKYYSKYSSFEDLISQNKDFFNTYVDTNKALLVPIPIHPIRKWKRWYNQSEKISYYLSSILDIPVNTKIIYKKRYTKHQSHLSQKERQKNLESSFWVRVNTFSNDTIIYLVDDVVSTGSTLLEAAKELRRFWFTDIRAIVLASD